MTLSMERPAAGTPSMLAAVAAALADLGFGGLLGAASRIDLEDAVLEAVRGVQLFPELKPTGSVRYDLLTLMQRWLGGLTRDERAMGVLLGAAEWYPRIREATFDALDRPLAAAVCAILRRAAEPPALDQVPLLIWVLRSVAVDRLRCGTARTQVDLEQLLDHLLPTG
jgi:hypothetical protein